MIDIRLPNITGKTEAEQLSQIKSYLYQFAGQLQWALSTVETGSSTNTVQKTSSANTGMAVSGVQQKEEELLKNFSDLKGLIIKSADIVNAYYEEINSRMEGLYVAQSEYGAFVEQTNAVTTQNSTNITTNYENIQMVTGRVTQSEKDIVSTKTTLEESISNTETSLAWNIDTAKTELADGITTTKEELSASIAYTETTLQGNIDNTKTELEDSISGTKEELYTSISDTRTTLEGSITETRTSLEGSITETANTLNENIDNAKTELEGSISTTKDELKGMIDSITAILVDVQAYIKSGLLFYDDNGVPVYGLEIGQTNTVNGVETFNKYARFTSDRLSFYDANDTEVAYISDYKLVITNAEIKGTLKTGGFVWDTSNGIALKWEGR